MLNYQMSMALADQRQRDLIAAAKRHARFVETGGAGRYNGADATGTALGVSHFREQLLYRLHVRRGTSPSTAASRGGGSTLPCAPVAGPVGCSA